METSLRNAKLWGADTVLLVPAVVKADVSYRDAWTRSQKEIRKLIKLAAELKVVIGIEEVWNHFLLSPMEFAKYVWTSQQPLGEGVLRCRQRRAVRVFRRSIRIVGPNREAALQGFRFRPVKGTGKIEDQFVNLQERQYRLEASPRRAR